MELAKGNKGVLIAVPSGARFRCGDLLAYVPKTQKIEKPKPRPIRESEY